MKLFTFLSQQAIDFLLQLSLCRLQTFKNFIKSCFWLHGQNHSCMDNRIETINYPASS